MRRSIIQNEKGFTLIEIIAVLIILGILAAVAVPRYIDLQEDARQKAAAAGIAEVKARMNLAFGKYLLQNNGNQPLTAGALFTIAGLGAANTLGDYIINLTDTGTTQMTISVVSINSVALATAVTDTWDVPQP